jgi:beta-galactosidase
MSELVDLTIAMDDPLAMSRVRWSGLAYGGDYNPEQWPEQTWTSDVALMREAKVSLVTVGVFAWARLQPRPGVFDADWLDRVMDLLADHDIVVDLATATASPPAWLAAQHPDVLPIDRDGNRLWYGSRQAWCPSSPVFRSHALALVELLAERYRDHPALAMWHVSNELGCHVAHCYCDTSATAFRTWLKERYGDTEALNQAWGTTFWSQLYGDWDEVMPPRITPAQANPGQQLDFARFSSDALLEHYRAERDLLRTITPDVPVTTNFMVTSHQRNLDYWAWAPEQDVISNDHYLDHRVPDPHVELSLCADWTRGLAGGEPWLLMEHSTSAVNWQPHNRAKAPGQMRRNSLQHVARGADFVGFFQWRASASGGEKFHSGMLPHAGTDTKVWREVVELGNTLAALGELAGTRVVGAQVALVLDYQSWWAGELDSHPSVDVRYLDRVLALYRALWDAGVTVDVRPPSAPLAGYALAVVPTLYLTRDADAARLSEFVADGGHLLVTYFSGLVDEYDRVRLGGYPGAFRELLGVRTEEFFPLGPGETVGLDDGTVADLWTEWLHLDGAQAEVRYTDGPLPGVPAITRHALGAGVARYVATRTSPDGTAAVIGRALADAGVSSSGAPAGVEVVRRGREGTTYAFVLNHLAEAVEVSVTGTDLITGATCPGRLRVAPGGVACVREEVA